MHLPDRNYLLVQTELFDYRQPDDAIDRWSVGADCAGWFYARLLPQNGVTPFRDPVMEDWGWTMALGVQTIPVWINVWAYHDIENTWLLGTETQKRFFSRTPASDFAHARSRICDALDSILHSDARFVAHKWFAENPFELLVKTL